MLWGCLGCGSQLIGACTEYSSPKIWASQDHCRLSRTSARARAWHCAILSLKVRLQLEALRSCALKPQISSTNWFACVECPTPALRFDLAAKLTKHRSGLFGLIPNWLGFVGPGMRSIASKLRFAMFQCRPFVDELFCAGGDHPQELFGPGELELRRLAQVRSRPD